MNENYFINKLKEHEFILVNYRQYIIEILKICPQINNTVLLKRIKEDFPDLEVPRVSFHRYIKKVREETGLVKLERKYKVREEILEALVVFIKESQEHLNVHILLIYIIYIMI